ncbi:MAG: antibiotic biosynthesis monooxygenase [Rhodospirillales bacterium]|nr:antibiotic biosynthesis monooxygenase [Rhodospirillales bacterium]
MMVVIFEVWPDDAKGGKYFDLAADLRPALEKIDGFISVERFKSIATEGKYVSLSFWRDEAAVKRWREHLDHDKAQKTGLFGGVFKDFRIRVAEVVRDYTMQDRVKAKAAAG